MANHAAAAANAKAMGRPGAPAVPNYDNRFIETPANPVSFNTAYKHTYPAPDYNKKTEYNQTFAPIKYEQLQKGYSNLPWDAAFDRKYQQKSNLKVLDRALQNRIRLSSNAYDGEPVSMSREAMVRRRNEIQRRMAEDARIRKGLGIKEP